MWEVTVLVKEISTGRELMSKPLEMFPSRSEAESYIFDESVKLDSNVEYVAAIIRHSTYGVFYADPSYWDTINMSKRLGD